MRKTIKLEVDGVELTVTLVEDSVTVSRVIGRDRKLKKDVLWVEPTVDRPSVEVLLKTLKRVAKRETARCRCDYRYGYSDHAEHCQSIYVAQEYRDEDD